MPSHLNSLGNLPRHQLLPTKGLCNPVSPEQCSAQIPHSPISINNQGIPTPPQPLYWAGKIEALQTEPTDLLSLHFSSSKRSPSLKFSSSLKITGKEEKPQGFLKKKSAALFQSVLKTLGLVPREPESHVILLPQELQAPNVRGPEALTVNHVLNKFKDQVQPITPEEVRQVALKVAP
ncbi:MAG: hypothetical protein K2X66_09990, partial [Cyanobacteria bacterium]|nr:hypothetical protein [Cyanobacteriota bacterium]